ncbi:sigma 54-interacting transcriptional regulator [Salsuginibacillus kocurii]|uniref:sigma 54-interacting transcriptional regulator n=1 Tax=Salsuginibacillus kocurii TaxID=427078 RepID=UPI000364E15B|nr:sigma 54-interacting transcriptional regulator [Salsuginibacillus kocurii]
MKAIDHVHTLLRKLSQSNETGVTAADLSKKLNLNRSTTSRYLNQLVHEHKAKKIPGKPVKYVALQEPNEQVDNLASGPLPTSASVNESLKPLLEKGLAALLYPSQPLPILLSGETGTGKTYLAELFHQTALTENYISEGTPFVSFNCADYAQNPQLLMGHIFGIKKGAFTGAEQDQPGLVERANGGILFLDEIHRLPSSGQEMLFYLIDKGHYRRLGESSNEREAFINIIGATTEEPSTSLLPTLLRRFSVKLTVPPLRERSINERKDLLERLLEEESEKMERGLFIQEDCRNAFLHYPCPGNVGQLKSDVQIACARAFMRFVNHNEESVIIKPQDLPDEVKQHIKTAMRKEHTLNVEHKCADKTDANKNSIVFPNIYQQLDEKSQELQEQSPKKVEQALQTVVNTYVTELLENSQHPTLALEGWRELLDADLLESLQQAYNTMRDQFPPHFDENQLYIIGLHLQTYRHQHQYHLKPAKLPLISENKSEYSELSEKLALHLEQDIQLCLPEEEVNLIAYFFTPLFFSSEDEERITIFLINHGDATASSMAAVTNHLLGEHIITGIDMPLHVSAEETYQQVRDQIISAQASTGILLLVDIGSLVTMGETLARELDMPIRTLSSVNLPMVLEAGRKALVPENSLQEIYQSSKAAMSAFVKESDQSAVPRKKRLIATVCFTGEGAAQLLEGWIETQISNFDEDVLIRSIRIDPVSKDASFLQHLRDYYDLIAIIGTVPIQIEEIPFIPAWELLNQEGLSRLLKLLEVTRPRELSSLHEDSEDSSFHLLSEGLAQIVTCLNPILFCSILEKRFPDISALYAWDEARELGMGMHLGGVVDRLILERLHGQSADLFSFHLKDEPQPLTTREETVWTPLLEELETSFHISFDEFLKKHLAGLSR